MARMGKDGYTDEETNQTKVTTRCPESLKEAYKAALDQQGTSMSKDLREHMEAVVEQAEEDSSTTDHLPDDDRLADAYRALRRNAAPETGRLDTDVAESVVAEATKVKGAVVRESVLEPLEQEEYITPNWGSIIVHPPTENKG